MEDHHITFNNINREGGETSSNPNTNPGPNPNVNRKGGETICREDAYALAALCGYTGAYKAVFADSFVGSSQLQFSAQMEEQEHFAPFPSVSLASSGFDLDLDPDLEIEYLGESYLLGRFASEAQGPEAYRSRDGS